jgi:hypothetical protein
MSDDDDIIIRQKISASLNKPTSLKRWVVGAIALVAFVLGAWIF